MLNNPHRTVFVEFCLTFYDLVLHEPCWKSDLFDCFLLTIISSAENDADDNYIAGVTMIHFVSKQKKAEKERKQSKVSEGFKSGQRSDRAVSRYTEYAVYMAQDKRFSSDCYLIK